MLVYTIYSTIVINQILYIDILHKACYLGDHII